MTHDDELRRRMNRMAEEVDPAPVTLESVEARGRQRTTRQRMMAVAAAFVFVVGAAFTLQTLTDNQGDTDVAGPAAEGDAADAATDGSADGNDGGDDTAQRDTDGEAVSTTTLPPEAMTADSEVALDAAAGYYYGEGEGYFGNQIVAWNGGFLAIGERFVPSDESLLDLVPDLYERLPAEIIDAMRDAGIEEGDPVTIEEIGMIVEEAGLEAEGEELLTTDPELVDAFIEASSGGTYERFAEFSADGVTWEPIDFDLPAADSNNGYIQFATNGDELVLMETVHEWDPQSGSTTGVTITIHVSTDGQTWTSSTLPIDVTRNNALEVVDVSPNSLAVGPDGWYLSIYNYRWIDVYSALPADVVDRMSAEGWGWDVNDDGVTLVSYPDEPGMDGEPVTEEEWIAFEEAWQPTVEEVVPWSDLPFTYDDYMNSHGPGESSGFVGDFSGTVKKATAPGDGFESGHVVATEAGFATLAFDYPDYELGIEPADSHFEVGDEWDGPTTSLWFSTDGVSWTERPLPEGEWYDSVFPVRDGLLLVTSGRFEDQQLWLGGPDATGWEPVAGPDIDYPHLWFQSNGNNGVASVIDIGHGVWPEFAPYEVTFTVDGVDLTVSVTDDGTQRVVAERDGEIVVDRSVVLWAEELWTYGDEGHELYDDDGELIVVIGWETMEETVWRAESDAWQVLEEANPYVPEFVLVASVDGRDWLVEPLPSDSDVWYEAAAVGNGVVVVRSGDTWTTYPIG